MLEEFKKFIMRGNVVDLAVGVIIGVALGRSFLAVADIIMPIVGAATGGSRFFQLLPAPPSKVQEGAAYADAKKQGAVIGYGQFLTTVGTSSLWRR